MTHGLKNMPQESTIERCNACYSAGGETAVAHAFLHTSCCEVLCSHVIPNFKTDHALSYSCPLDLAQWLPSD